jgi:hypothetical protein
MTGFASSLVNWSALWRIVLVALIGGGGVVLSMGLALVSLDRARAVNGRVLRLGYRGLAGVCGACCVGVVAVGIYAMTQKPSAKPAAKAKTASVTTRSHAAGS